MRKVNRLAAVAVALILLAAVAAPALASGSDVGNFLTLLAQSKNLNATDPAIALDSLRGVGIRLSPDLKLDKKLTEADVADISRHNFACRRPAGYDQQSGRVLRRDEGRPILPGLLGRVGSERERRRRIHYDGVRPVGRELRQPGPGQWTGNG